MKHLNQYKNDSFDLKALPLYKNENFNSKSLTSYITEYIIKKKLDKPINSEDHYEYYPKTQKELIKILNELISQNTLTFHLFCKTCMMRKNC